MDLRLDAAAVKTKLFAHACNQNSGSLLIINLPPTFWQPKVVNAFKMPVYDDIHEGVFDYKQYGNCVFRPTFSWDSGKRTDIIAWDDSKHSAELHKGLHVGSLASAAIRLEIIAIIKRHWDCFCDEGSHRTILGYEFAIDTGDHTPICCKKPTYGFHESKVIMKHVLTLLANVWIRKCGGPWGSLIVLAAKPH